ncbi:uncharacterized protein LOC134433802 [Melospiza melodia melodia]|uniref:uncharacterized protein LOC134433802 n=1 Tax=Melospiza melodia melodia TaxID=1914991 RepID=UPI002FD5AB58
MLVSTPVPPGDIHSPPECASPFLSTQSAEGSAALQPLTPAVKLGTARPATFTPLLPIKLHLRPLINRGALRPPGPGSTPPKPKQAGSPSPQVPCPRSSAPTLPQPSTERGSSPTRQLTAHRPQPPEHAAGRQHPPL